MDRILAVFGQSDGSIKPEILIVYGAMAVLVTILVNWALAVVLFMLKPLTCAAILMAFIRPDLAQNFLQEHYMTLFMEKSKVVFMGVTNFILRLGEQFHQKFN